MERSKRIRLCVLWCYCRMHVLLESGETGRGAMGYEVGLAAIDVLTRGAYLYLLLRTGGWQARV